MATNYRKPHKKRGGADRDCGSSDEDERMPSIELPNSRNMPVMTEFVTAEGNGMITLHETKKAAAAAAMITLGVLSTLIHKAMAAGVRVTERCKTGFRFAVPTYMERLVLINIDEWRPRQLMLEAFFLPENAQAKQIMPPPAALALMHPDFLARMKRVIETTLPAGFFPERLVLPPTLLRRPAETKDEPPACPEEEPPARTEDVDSILEEVERELEHGLTLEASIPEKDEAAVPEGDEAAVPEGK